MREKPILFSTPMVRAILDGRKTQTRRVIKNKDIINGFDIDIDGKAIAYIDRATGDSYPPDTMVRYQPGDRLWVRETWNYSPNWYYCYKADAVPEDNHGYFSSIPWRPSIYMPREAARIFLRVTNVRVERLQDITPLDAWHEGCRIGNSFPWEEHIPELQQQCRDIMFKNLWDSLNAKRGYGWDSNPWVEVVEFKRVADENEGERKEG